VSRQYSTCGLPKVVEIVEMICVKKWCLGIVPSLFTAWENQLLAHADDVNLLGDNLDAIMKNM
jgi:hypothetical protein